MWMMSCYDIMHGGHVIRTNSDWLDFEVQSNETEDETLEVLDEVVEYTQPFLISGWRGGKYRQRERRKKEGG